MHYVLRHGCKFCEIGSRKNVSVWTGYFAQLISIDFSADSKRINFNILIFDSSGCYWKRRVRSSVCCLFAVCNNNSNLRRKKENILLVSQDIWKNKIEFYQRWSRCSHFNISKTERLTSRAFPHWPLFILFFCNSFIILFLLLCRDGEFSSSDIFVGQILSSVNRQFPSCLRLYLRVNAKLLIRNDLILIKKKLIFKRKVLHVPSIWKWGILELMAYIWGWVQHNTLSIVLKQEAIV